MDYLICTMFILSLFCSNYNMRGRAAEILVEGSSMRRVAKREDYSDVIERFRIKIEETEKDLDEESGAEGETS